MSTRIRWRVLVMAGALALGLMVVTQGLSAAATVWLVTLRIVESIDPDTPHAVSADALGPLYSDYRIGGGDFCVEATLSSSLFIRFNRKLDGDMGTLYCGLNLVLNSAITVTYSPHSRGRPFGVGVRESGQ